MIYEIGGTIVKKKKPDLRKLVEGVEIYHSKLSACNNLSGQNRNVNVRKLDQFIVHRASLRPLFLQKINNVHLELGTRMKKTQAKLNIETTASGQWGDI